MRYESQRRAEAKYDAKRGDTKLTIRFKTEEAKEDLKAIAANNNLTLSELFLKSVDIAKKAGEIE